MTREEAINKLKYLINSPVGREEIDETCYEVMEYLSAQAPRVMTWEEAQANVNEGPFIIMEVRDSTGTEIDYGVLVGDSYEMSEGSLLTVCNFGLLKDDYGKRFRCWTSRPDDKRRAETPWN
jgi:hypothetical protein